MRALTFIAGTLCLAAMPTLASANCYFIFSPQNQLIYRSTTSPVDLSRPISEGLRGRFAGGHLTMIPDETGCPDLLSSGESQVFASFGFVTAAGRSTSPIEASPLFRNAESRSTGSDAGLGSSEGSALRSTAAGGSARAPTRRSGGAGAAAPR